VLCAAARPARPLRASLTSYPSYRSAVDTASTMELSSSMTRILRASPTPVVNSLRPPVWTRAPDLCERAQRAHSWHTAPLPTVQRMDKLFGLPAHPFLVHIPIVLLPLAAIGVALMAIKTDWYLRYRWPVLVIGLIGALGAVLAAAAGEQLEGRIIAVEGRDAARSWEHHADLGDTARLFAVIFCILLAAYVLIPWWLHRRHADATIASPAALGRSLRIALATLAVLGAVASVTTVIQAGHTGSESVWQDYVSKTSNGG
jgi:hypothetical protein